MVGILKHSRTSRRLFAVAVLFFAATSANANPSGHGWHFGWNMGNVRISYDPVNNSQLVDVEVLTGRWMHDNGFTFWWSAFEFLDILNDDKMVMSFLPLLYIGYTPVNINNTLFFSVYGGIGGMETRFQNEDRTDIDFYWSVGARFMFFPIGRFDFGYTPYLSAFFEYNSRNELRIGIGVEVNAPLLALGMAIQERRARRGQFLGDF